MSIYNISPDEWGWDLFTSELDDDLFEAIKKLSRMNEFDKCVEGEYEYKHGYRWWFPISYDIRNDSKWKVGKNNYRKVIKLLNDNGFKEIQNV